MGNEQIGLLLTLNLLTELIILYIGREFQDKVTFFPKQNLTEANLITDDLKEMTMFESYELLVSELMQEDKK